MSSWLGWMCLLAVVFPCLACFSFGLLLHSFICSAPSPSTCYFFEQISATESLKGQAPTLSPHLLLSEAPVELPLRAHLLLQPQPLALEPQSSQSCRGSGQSQGCCQQTTGTDLLPSCPEAMICLSQQQAVLSNYLLVVLHPLSPMIFTAW